MLIFLFFLEYYISEIFFWYFSFTFISMNNGRAKNVGIGSKWLKFLKHWSFKVVNSVTFTQWINRFAIFVLNLHSFLSFVGKISILENTVHNFGIKYIMSTRGRRGGGGVVIPPEADCLDILPKNIHKNTVSELCRKYYILVVAVLSESKVSANSALTWDSLSIFQNSTSNVKIKTR